MFTTTTAGPRASTLTRPLAAALALVGALLVSACGGTTATSSSSSGPAQTPAATPLTTATPGPSSVQAALVGDAKVTGPLTVGNIQFVNCEEPSLQGETIYAFRNTADPAVATLITIRAGSIEVRLASGSGTSYTERTFAGTGVTAFGAASGAQFSSSLTEDTPATSNKGTIEAISSISGSVSCGSFTPGSGTVTVAGTTPAGSVSGALTSLRVTCGGTAPNLFASVGGLTAIGSTPAGVSIGGGEGANPFFVTISTAAGTTQYTATAPGLVTRSGSSVTYAVTAATQSAPAGTATVMVTGTVTCGT